VRQVVGFVVQGVLLLLAAYILFEVVVEWGPGMVASGFELVVGLALFCVFVGVVGVLLLGAQWVWEWLEFAWDRVLRR
jgi:hypothetical protein